MRPRVLLADDHRLLLDAFKTLLAPDYHVVGTVTDGYALLEKAQDLKPDVVVADVSMPLLNGLDAGAQLKRIFPRVKLVYLTVNEDPNMAAEAFAAGASGYVLKRSASSELFHAIQEVLQGRSYVSPLLAGDMDPASGRESDRRLASTELSARQRQVLQLLAEGRSMKEAARILKVTPRTVAFHKYRMMEELNLKNSAELIQYAIKNQMVSP